MSLIIGCTTPMRSASSIWVSPRSLRRRLMPSPTTFGKFSSLERRYWASALSEAEEESFERIIYMMGRLYKEVRA
jgi:hypothetical protein